MSVCLPFAFPFLAKRTHLPPAEAFESAGAWGLLISMGISVVVGGLLMFVGRKGRGATLFQKEAMAIVGLSWVLATVLGAMPFYFSGTALRLDATGTPQAVSFLSLIHI